MSLHGAFVPDHGDSGFKVDSCHWARSVQLPLSSAAAPKFESLPPASSFATDLVSDYRRGFWTTLCQDDDFSDSVLRSTDGGRYKVNRVVLAASSPYFRTLFANYLSQGTEPRIEIKSSDLEVLLQFAYTGTCPLSPLSVQTLLPIADKYQIQDLADHCCAYFTTQLEPANALGIYLFTRNFFVPDFNAAVRHYVLRKFKEVARSRREFRHMEAELFESLLRDDFLCVETEEMVYEAVCSWVDERFEERLPKMLGLLTCLRYGLMSYAFFSHFVLSSKYTEASKEIRDYICSYVEPLISPYAPNPLDDYDILRRPRIPSAFIFTIGGWSALNPMTFVEHYDIMADRWMPTPIQDITPRAYHGVIFLGGLLYIFGGNDGYDNLSSMYALDPVTQLWTEKACMHEKRCYVSSACLDKKIYAMGGHTALARTNSAEVYDPSMNQWTTIAPMQDVRSDASACVINDRIYIAGGFTGDHVLDTVEFYTPTTNQWTRVTSMTTPRCGLSLTVFGSYLYALGGRMGPTSLRTGERLNLLYNGWETTTPMPITRSNHGSAVLNGVIFVIGGYINGEEGLTNQVDIFEPESGTWVTSRPLKLNRSGFTACVVKDIPNPQVYAYVGRLKDNRGLGELESRKDKAPKSGPDLT